MKTAISLLLITSLISMFPFGSLASTWVYEGQRIAISADGNNQADILHFWPRADPDDWGATPAALAIIAKLGKKKALVHYSYNNFIDSPKHTSDVNEMAIGVNGAIQHWAYDASKFFDVSENYELALVDLVSALEVSSENDPLFFIHMGPSEFLYRAVKRVIERGNADSLAHIYLISHSGYNDNHLRRGDPKFDKKPVQENQKHHTLTDVIALSDGRINYKKIKDQNAKWEPTKLWHSDQDWSVWQWMQVHQDTSVKWIYERMKRHPLGVADISDAGMVYFLLTGDENGSPEKFKTLIGKSIN
ncbi:hypothetical protein [Agaribacter marinus]|uniref:Uncharacterized protein n=1 Tax=Agaribacter marinus TaxID=1431249 RepID=A0AA37WJ87_9ALTE|nr:hypothetical protein [Agaribacter marinus]GLR71762.1 hypothetical protein GCM10007852_26700 [Agaribacter marinus]